MFFFCYKVYGDRFFRNMFRQYSIQFYIIWVGYKKKKFSPANSQIYNGRKGTREASKSLLYAYPPVHFTQLWTNACTSIFLKNYPRVGEYKTPLPCWVRMDLIMHGASIFSFWFYVWSDTFFAIRKRNYEWNNLQLVQDSMCVLFSQKNICGQSNTFQNI